MLQYKSPFTTPLEGNGCRQVPILSWFELIKTEQLSLHSKALKEIRGWKKNREGGWEGGVGGICTSAACSPGLNWNLM